MARFARQGLRMVAAACKPARLDATTLNHEDLQEGLIFLGIAGMMDPRVRKPLTPSTPASRPGSA